MYAIQTARLNNRTAAIARYQELDSIGKRQVSICDSAMRKTYAENLKMRERVLSLERKSSNRAIAVPVFFAIGMLLGITLN